MTKLPESFRGYFWDVDFDELDFQKHEFLIIKRVLDRGKTSDIKWILSHYGKGKIKEVLTTTHDLSRITGSFWSGILKVPKNKVPCLQTPYSPIRFGLSS